MRSPSPTAATTDTTTGIAAGTRVMTLDGALPVEYLTPGDRVVTRDGAMVLRRVTARKVRRAGMVRVAPGALGHGRPGRDMWIGADQPVMVRDWRAKALYGQTRAVVPAARLADGEYMRRGTLAEARLYTLEFDRPQVIYADGVEVACAPATAGA